MMNVMVISIILAMPILTVILLPFWASYQQASLKQSADARQLEDQLQRLVGSVRDLDFDFDTGKVPQADYITQRKLLIGRGVSALLKLRESRQLTAKAVNDDLEKLIAAYKTKPVKS